MQWLNLIDTYFFRLINSSGFDQMDGFMQLISNKFFWIPLYVYLAYLIYKKFPASFLKILLSLGILIFFADQGSVHLFKEVFQRLRPCHALDQVRLIGDCGGQFGFISSHASNSFALAFFLGLIFKDFRIFFFLFSWATFIGFSRVYLGVHYPFDVLGGMFWGLFVSLLTYFIFNNYLQNNRE